MLHALKGFLHSKPWRGGGLKITGTLTASFDQQSVVSLETFRTELKTEVERYFLPSRGKPDEEVNDDIDYIENGMVDLGEIMTETLALELDPYPRKPGEVFQDIQEDVEAEKITPFAALSKLKPASSDEKK